jgi:hypothetical protein
MYHKQFSHQVAQHRGALILTLGIVSLKFLCTLGIVTLVMSKNDLKAMRFGRMDRKRESLTTVGYIHGIISVLIFGIQAFFGAFAMLGLL